MRTLFGFIQQHRTFFLFVLLFAVAVGMLASQTEDREDTSFLARLLLELFSPFQKGITRSMDFFHEVWQRYLYLVDLEEENRLLREIVAEMRQERNRLLEARAENERLRALLDLRRDFPRPLLPALVVGKDAGGWFRTLVIDRGVHDGVGEGMAVLSVQGIVGQVMESSGNFSRVLLLSDRNSAVAALVQRTRARGIVEGTGLDHCRMKYLHRSEDVRQGDRVLSSGLDGVYPKGILIGTVTRVRKRETQLFQDVTIEPSVDFQKLEEVAVLCETPLQMGE